MLCVRYFLSRVFSFLKNSLNTLYLKFDEFLIYVKQKISYLLNRYYYNNNDLNVVMKFDDDMIIHTIIDNDIYSGNNYIYACPKCKSLCLKENNSIKNIYISDKELFYKYFSKYNLIYFQSHRYSWIYDICCEQLDSKVKSWYLTFNANTESLSFREYDLKFKSSSFVFNGCQNNVIFLWKHNIVYRIYFLEYSDFVKGNFSINNEHLFYLNGIIVDISDKTDEYIEFDWIFLNDDSDFSDEKKGSSFGSCEYMGSYIYNIRNNLVVILDKRYKCPPIFKNYVYK